jgi:hypothetical protein
MIDLSPVHAAAARGYARIVHALLVRGCGDIDQRVSLWQSITFITACRGG